MNSVGLSSILLVADGHLVRVLVHAQFAGADDGLFVVVHGATEDRLEARDDLVEAERLGDVVVAADGEAGDLVLGVVFRGQEQDGRRVAGCPEALGDAEPVHVGQHDVEDDEVGLLLEDRGDRLAPLPTARTAKPANRRLVVRRSRMLGSSSTIRILGPSLMQ